MASNDSRLQQQPSQKDAADQNFDYMFKLLIIGNSSVGKTSFLFRYADDSFTSAFVSTVGIDFKVKTVFRNDKRIKLQIWVSRLKLQYIEVFICYVTLWYHTSDSINNSFCQPNHSQMQHLFNVKFITSPPLSYTSP